MTDEFKHIDPPKYKVRVYVAADGGDGSQATTKSQPRRGNSDK